MTSSELLIVVVADETPSLSSSPIFCSSENEVGLTSVRDVDEIVAESPIRKRLSGICDHLVAGVVPLLSLI
jgi:hypothetical protein